ncbi:MAG: hypothetical protein KF886_15790 [Candidatus Hydrogenedentes bacterium]|nr:hypothetical protein [Candidatus Hydrogenedentota bacterium]
MDDLMEPLMRYDWGGERASLYAIDGAVREAHGDPERLLAIERALIGVLQSDAPVPAKEYVCRQLALIGSAASVPVLAGMLADAALLDRALYALQAIPDGAAGSALREALPAATGAARIGIVNALGERRDPGCKPALEAVADDGDLVLRAAIQSARRKIGAV